MRLVMRTHEPAIFAFLDALFDRKKDALSRLYELELSGVAELEIISRIENQIINHYVVLLRQGLEEDEDPRLCGRKGHEAQVLLEHCATYHPA